jgi:hypothetical protein
MFAIPPAAPEIEDLQSLSDAIDALCEILEGDRAVVIEELTGIIRRRAVFEQYKRTLEDDDIQ